MYKEHKIFCCSLVPAKSNRCITSGMSMEHFTFFSRFWVLNMLKVQEQESSFHFQSACMFSHGAPPVG